jgi:hypothetical protein
MLHAAGGSLRQKGHKDITVIGYEVGGRNYQEPHVNNKALGQLALPADFRDLPPSISG